MTVDFMYQLLQSHRLEVAAWWKLRPRTRRFQERWLPALGNAGSPFLLALHLLPFLLITRVLTATLWYYKGCEIRGDKVLNEGCSEHAKYPNAHKIISSAHYNYPTTTHPSPHMHQCRHILMKAQYRNSNEVAHMLVHPYTP